MSAGIPLAAAIAATVDQLESLVSEATGQPIARTALADPAGYGLGATQQTSSQMSTASRLRIPARPRSPAGIRGPVNPGPDSS